MTSPHPDAEDVVITSERGPIAALFHDCESPRAALLTVGGFNGGFDGPAEGIYARLAADMPARGIAVLRLDFRVKTAPGPIDDGTFDVLAGIDWLAARDRAPVLLIGHSYGGAIVVRAGVRSELVAGVVTLATQTAGIEEIAQLAPRPVLLVHGDADTRLSPRLSRWAYQEAGEPKRLHILPGATHSLRQARDELWRLLTAWIDDVAPAAASPADGGG